MTENVNIPYPAPGTPMFQQLDNYTMTLLFTGSDPKPETFNGFAVEQNQVLPAFSVVGLNARRKLVPATVSGDTVTHFVTDATVNAPGSGGTNGNVTLTGVNGTGTKFQATGVIAGGVLTEINTVSVEGSYSVAPGAVGEAVTGGNLTGATLNLTIETLEAVTEGVQALGVTTEAITTAVGQDNVRLPIWISGNFSIRALNWDATFTDDEQKYRAFQGAPSPTRIVIQKRQSDI